MTTSVTVTPAGHRVRVQKNHVTNGQVRTQETIILEPGSPAQTFHVHQSLSLDIAELDANDKPVNEAAAPAEENKLD